MKKKLSAHGNSLFSGLSWPNANPEELSLLRACLLNTTDTDPRLLLADWYEHHRQQHLADFIRIQCDYFSRKTINAKRKQDATNAARVYWKPKFQSKTLECLLSTDAHTVPRRRENDPTQQYTREFVLGLPTRVIVGVRTLHRLFSSQQEQLVLSLLTDLEITNDPVNQWRGVYGNYHHHQESHRLSKEIQVCLDSSQCFGPWITLDLFGQRVDPDTQPRR